MFLYYYEWKKKAKKSITIHRIIQLQQLFPYRISQGDLYASSIQGDTSGVPDRDRTCVASFGGPHFSTKLRGQRIENISRQDKEKWKNGKKIEYNFIIIVP